MDTLITRPTRNTSAMEIEVPRQNSSSDIAEPLQPTSRFAELQLRRERRRTSENKFTNLTNADGADVTKKLCEFCQQLILRSLYDQHILDCNKQNLEQPKDNGRLIEESKNHEEERLTNTIEVEENQFQVATPVGNPMQNPPQENPENYFNLFGRFRNPIRNSQRNEPPQSQFPSPLSFFSNIFHSIFRPHERTENLPIEQSSVEGTNLPLADQPQNESEPLPHGVLLVRTIQPGPNGSVIVRMRVIPLNGLFSNPQNNTENNEPQEGGLLGSLLNMLMTLHGIHDDFLNLFQEEKGLEKEVLDSLPIVSYDADKFKNVDDESKKCSICLEQFQDEQEVRFLWCLHRFHKNCVDQWLDSHTNCPICKKDYSEAVKSCEGTSS